MLDEMLTTGLLNFFFTGLLLAGLPEPLMGEGRVNLEASFSFWASSLMVSIMERVLTPDFCILDVVCRFVSIRHPPAKEQQAILMKGNVSFNLQLFSCVSHRPYKLILHLTRLEQVFFYSIVTEADCVIAYCGSACVNLEKSNFLIQRMYHIASSGCKQQLPI